MKILSVFIFNVLSVSAIPLRYITFWLYVDRLDSLLYMAAYSLIDNALAGNDKVEMTIGIVNVFFKLLVDGLNMLNVFP